MFVMWMLHLNRRGTGVRAVGETIRALALTAVFCADQQALAVLMAHAPTLGAVPLALAVGVAVLVLVDSGVALAVAITPPSLVAAVLGTVAHGCRHTGAARSGEPDRRDMGVEA